VPAYESGTARRPPSLAARVPGSPASMDGHPGTSFIVKLTTSTREKRMSNESEKSRAEWHLRQALLTGAVSGAVRAVLGWLLEHWLG
jgi:hypothetical protein